MSAEEARAKLRSHLESRLTRAVIGAAGVSPSSASDIGISASQLSSFIAPPTSGLALERTGVEPDRVDQRKSTLTPVSSAAPRHNTLSRPAPTSNGSAARESRPFSDSPDATAPPHATATAPAAAQPAATSSPAQDEFALEELVRRQAGSILTLPVGSNHVRTSITDTPAAMRRLEGLGASSNGRGSQPAVDSSGPPIDRVEFAEHLRMALIDDARRHGIEV